MSITTTVKNVDLSICMDFRIGEHYNSFFFNSDILKIKISIILLTLLLLTGIASANVDYRYDVIGYKGQVGLTRLGYWPSINDNGTVAFMGEYTTSMTNYGVFIGDGQSTPRNINPGFGNRRIDDAVQINNLNKVAVKDMLPGSPPKTRIRVWDGNAIDSYNQIAMGGGTFDSYDAVLSPVSMNNNNKLVFAALKGNSELLVTPGFIGFNEITLQFPLRPMIADNGNIVVKAFDSINLYNYDLGLIETIAGPFNGFTKVGMRPGISDDGSIIVFAGDRGAGTGIFASVKEGPSRSLQKIAGEGAPELGNDSSGSPIYFSSFDIDTRVAAIHQELGIAGLTNDSFVVTFMATPSAASSGNFTANKGIWTVRLDAWTPVPYQYRKTKPSSVMQIGDMFLSNNASASGMISALDFFDSIANAATTDSGKPRIQLRGEHRLAFWASIGSGELIIRASNTSDRPDLKVNSSSISISPAGVNVTVHNIGNAKAKSINVKIIRELKEFDIIIDNETKVITEISGGGSEKVSVNWDLSELEDVKVIVDPDNFINEDDEANNEAETHKIKGRIAEEISGNESLKYAKVEYKEYSGVDWETIYTTFTDDEGWYYIHLSNENISKEKKGRVDVNLTFSPKRDISKIKANFIPSLNWGPDDEPVAGAQPSSKSIVISDSIDKEKDYPNKNITFKPDEGGSVYWALTNSYLYFKKPTFLYESNNVLNVDYDDTYHGSYYMSATNTIHINATRLQVSQGWGKHSTAHEYGHRVSDTWGMPYGPGGPGDGIKQNGLDENWANFASSLARNDPEPHGSAGWNLNLNTHKVVIRNPVTLVNELKNITIDNAWAWGITDSWWELNNRSIRTPNNVAESLRITHPVTLRSFYEDYRDRDLTRTDPKIKAIFRRRGYDTTGWPPAGPGDPDFFTNYFSDHKVDSNADGTAEYLNIDVGLNITSSGNYAVYGFLTDSRNKEYCFAINNTFLNSGIQTATLEFNGECIFQNKLNGTYRITSVYLADETKEEIDYRTDIYDTSAYRYTEFRQPVAAFIGTYTDHGLDTDGDGLYDFLIIDLPVNVSIAGKYILSGSLFDGSGNNVGDYYEESFMNKSQNKVEVKFPGVTIHANGKNGPFLVKGLSIMDTDEHQVFYDPEAYVTGAYDYTQFQVPEGSFNGGITEHPEDTDGDGSYNNLIVIPDLNITSNRNYALVGRLSNSTGYGITIANNYSYLNKGIRTLSLIYNGEILRRTKLDGPYNITFILYSNSTIIGKRTYTTSPYNFSQFQSAPEDFFETSFSDHGTDLDGNGRYEYLTIDVNISTGVRSGNYTFEGYLINENNVIVGYSKNMSYINTEPRMLNFDFNGQIIWKTRSINGKYKLKLLVSDENRTKIAGLDDAHVTAVYRYDEFEFPISPIVTDLKNTTFSETYINWTWTDPTIADFSEVNVWVDGVFKTNVSKGVQFYNATGFSPETEHTISVRTVNISGVVVDPTWVTHTAWTAPIQIPPVIFNKFPLQGTKYPIGTDSVFLSLQTDKMSECRLSETNRDFSEMTRFDITNSVFHLTTVNGLINGTDYTFYINCRDNSGAQNNTEFFSFYIFNRTFLPPVIEPFPDVTAFENDTVSISINATDPENDPLTITVQDRSMFGYVPIASRFTVENQTLKLRTNYDDAGRYYLRVAVSDGKDTVTRDFTLNIINVNRPPVLLPIGNKLAIEGTFFSTTIHAIDPDGNDLRFSDNTSLFNINPFNGQISFTPKNYQAGDHYVNISVTDGEFTAYEIVLFNIKNVNNPPVIEPILPKKAIPDELFTLQINASDPDHDNLTFSDDTDLFNISTQGLINFTPSRSDEGKYLINITVSDSLANDTNILNLVISVIIRPPIITNITDRIIVYRNQSFEINVTACDPGIDAGCN